MNTRIRGPAAAFLIAAGASAVFLFLRALFMGIVGADSFSANLMAIFSLSAAIIAAAAGIIALISGKPREKEHAP